MPWDADTYLIQCGLNALHYNVGELDGIHGRKTARAKAQFLAARAQDMRDIGDYDPPPASDFASMVDYYGQPGDESNLVMIQLPYVMRLAWRKESIVTRTRCHKRIAQPLVGALTELLDSYGIAWISKHGLDLYGGCYNNRKVRGGQSKSKHAWGAAIDLNPARNGNQLPWRIEKVGSENYASMPIEAIVIFERHGFKSAARAWGRDAMHFEYTA